MTEFLDAQAFGESLQRDLARCSSFRAAVSYIRSSGIPALLNASPEQVSRSLIITCTDFGITEPEALRALLDHGYKLRAFRTSGLHAKVWLLEFANQEPVMFLGSSNLSGAATSSNVEANLRVAQSDSLAEAGAWFERLTSDELTMGIGKPFIDEYQRIRILAPPQERMIPLMSFSEPQSIPETNVPASQPVVVDERTNTNGRWHARPAGHTFLTQGIPESLAEISYPGLPQHGHTRGVRLILLTKGTDGNWVVWKDIPNNTFNASRQLGTNRKTVLNWKHSIWGNAQHFEYEVAIDAHDGQPTVWLRPRS